LLGFNEKKIEKFPADQTTREWPVLAHFGKQHVHLQGSRT